MADDDQKTGGPVNDQDNTNNSDLTLSGFKPANPKKKRPPKNKKPKNQNTGQQMQQGQKQQKKQNQSQQPVSENVAKKEMTAPVKKQKSKRKQDWYEKFHWFISSEGFLCIGGRDATTNEIVIKKHTDKEDFVFHTEAPGSPFFVIKTESGEGKEPTKKTFEEVALATGVFSKAWKLGLSSTEVFMVKPEHVSKEAQSGEYIAKGAFMIYGKREFFTTKMES